MEKLELKYLAPYLPYKLPLWSIEELPFAELAEDEKSKHMIGMSTNNIAGVIKELYKPILRPLSDLIKSIDINGKKFIPITFFDKKTQSNILDCLDELEMLENNINILPLYVCEYLFEWYFDVFGLIEKGLAIDINTL